MTGLVSRGVDGVGYRAWSENTPHLSYPLCQIGTVTFEGDEIVGSWQTLVNPEDHFDGMNISIHGIDQHAVQDVPTFPQYVRFDERGLETGSSDGPRHRLPAKAAGQQLLPVVLATAPVLDSTESGAGHGRKLPLGKVGSSALSGPDMITSWFRGEEQVGTWIFFTHSADRRVEPQEVFSWSGLESYW